MRNKIRPSVLKALLSGARYEVLPTTGAVDKVLESVAPGRTITVTASAAKGLEATIDVAEVLSRNGYHAVPHLAARMIRDAHELRDISDRLAAAGIDSIFVPAGDATPPAGDFAASLDLLRCLAELDHPFRQIGIAGYPESHPFIADDVVSQALVDKRDYATNIVSNLCFDPKLVTGWLDRLRSAGTGTPVLIGMPGPIERHKLLTMATKIGLGDSAKFLAKNRRLFTRILAPGGYGPERFISGLAPALNSERARVQGLHLYTFNQIAETEHWRRNWLDRLAAVTT
ncbi:methylenetetrahydrofolate reductase [Saxibacter everestensis]|uniref:Methylenetetrahydrofolate reductase n=1 Tax=Saxibacter everestensis TaxID=2909229 RepID=A0ABY8QXI2_9MICO|nr:methylenetetrahydrofolate reductase [Brevibacteriaceae bacterium ZFBP1038]